MSTRSRKLRPLEPTPLPRGGLVVATSAGVVQIGAPPETIKDTIESPDGVANIFVLADDLFSYERCISIAEVEFPIYYNYFILHKRLRLLCTTQQRDAIAAVMQESLFGPAHIDLSNEIDGTPEDHDWYPDLPRELAWFRNKPSDPSGSLQFSDLVETHLFDEHDGRIELDGVVVERLDGAFVVTDPLSEPGSVRVPSVVRLRPHTSEADPDRGAFQAPQLGVTILGSGHGFEPRGKTTGFVLWCQRRGIIVDPPVDSVQWLRERQVSPDAIDAVILTHCHADHDGGLLQKALQARRVRLYTTPTIYRSFLRKAEAITGLPAHRVEAVFDFRPVPIRTPIEIAGARFVFNYTLHSIPTIRFEVWLGGKSLVYSADTLYDPDQIEAMRVAGVLSDGRAADLLHYPWHHDLVIHEAGVPPIHTPPEVLGRLPDDVKKRLLLVHTTGESIPKGLGLKLAPLGLENTIRMGATASTESESNQWVHAMRCVAYFTDLPPERDSELLERVTLRRFAAGTEVLKRGGVGRHFYVILTGKAAVLHGEVPKKVFGMYESFGEAALVLGGLRTADIVALSDLVVLEIDKESFEYLLRGTDGLERARRLCANRDRDSWALMHRHPVLRLMVSGHRAELQSLMRHVELPPGEVLLERGAPSPCGFLVESGALVVTDAEDRSDELSEGGLALPVDAVCDGEPSPVQMRAGARGCSGFVMDNEPLARFLLASPGIYLRLLNMPAS